MCFLKYCSYYLVNFVFPKSFILYLAKGYTYGFKGLKDWNYVDGKQHNLKEEDQQNLDSENQLKLDNEEQPNVEIYEDI